MFTTTMASAKDIDDISRLLQANTAAHGGTLTGEFDRNTVVRMLDAGMPVIIAQEQDRLLGVVFSHAMGNPKAPPVVTAMEKAWPGSPGAYIYGPVCIDASARGRGILTLLYESLKQALPGREAVLFIRRHNVASLTAHQRLGMCEVAGFSAGGEEFAVFSDKAIKSKESKDSTRQ